MTTWAELRIDAPAETAEIVAAYVALRGGGVEIRDGETLLRPARPGRTELCAYVPVPDAESHVAELSGRFADLNISVQVRNEDEWRDLWKQYFKPRRVGSRFVIKPTWEPFAAAPGDLVIELDPGRAFGTGNHESTQLCMLLMEQLPEPRRFIDVGTGSGILAIAAARLWPGASGLAIDIDADAVACARENVALLQLASRIDTADIPLESVTERFECVIANITAETLLAVQDALLVRVAAGGYAILSGMLHDGADRVAAAFARTPGVERVRVLDQGEWRGLVLRRVS
jgi:ribosomal protein L11 methyltransferase